MTFSCDGTEIADRSYTPMVAKIVNYFPQARQLLGNLKLMGWMQPGVLDYQAHLLPFVRQLAKHQPNGVPLKVHAQRHAALPFGTTYRIIRVRWVS